MASRAAVVPPRRSIAKLLAYGLILAALFWSWRGAEMRPLDLLRDSGNMAVFLKDFFPPDFHDWRYYVEEMAITVQIAVWGTALAIFCAVPFGLLCAANIAP